MKPEEEKNTANPFLALSVILTGFESVELLGTGLVETYANVIISTVGQTISDQLWATTTQIIARYGDREAQLETAIRHEILASSMLGPIARNIIQLWYVGTWNELPQSWRNLYGNNPNDTTRIISSEAYAQGLVWDVIGAHPPAAKQPGFDSWSQLPTSDKH